MAVVGSASVARHGQHVLVTRRASRPDRTEEATSRSREGQYMYLASWAHVRARMPARDMPASFDIEKAEVPPVPQTLARISPVNGRKSLYVGSHAAYIRDMDRGEGRALLDELLAHAANDKFVYVHKWSVGDLVMWDNRCVNHRGRPWDSQRYRRVMRRTTVAGDAPTV